MNQKCYHWLGIWITATLLFFQPVLAEAKKSGCVTLNAKRSFVQLWRADAARTEKEWDKRLKDLVNLGFEEIIVQWSIYGDVSFFDDPRKGFENASCLSKLIRSAARQKVRIQLGLQYDPEFWKHIGNSRKVENYLQKRLKTIISSLDPLLSVVMKSDPKGTVVNGWYISDEIDDQNWDVRGHKAALAKYLRTIRQHLSQKKKHWPVSISGYTTGADLPVQWGQFWKSLLNETGIDMFLFQDGIGTGQMDLANLPVYLSALSSALNDAPAKLGVVVEIFDVQKSSAVFQTQSAAFKRITEQLQLADKHSEFGITVFSAPDHLIGKKSQRKTKLHRLWLEDQQRCQRYPDNRPLQQ